MDASTALESGRSYRCQKSARDIPFAEPRCENPRAYCKWRTACPIHALEKELARRVR